MDKQAEVLQWLEGLGVPFALHHHQAAYTMEDMLAFGMCEVALVAKNLFLRDHKGKRHFLVVVAGDKPVNLKAFGAMLGTRVSFASPERLAKYLNLAKGEVTPLGLYYDKESAVEVYLDRDLKHQPRIGVHPGTNTATVVLDFAGLQKAVESCGNAWQFLEIP